jgi:hypothetical protein
MFSYMEEQLQASINDLKFRASRFTMKLNSAKLEVSRPVSNDESFIRLGIRVTNIEEAITILDDADEQRQKRWWTTPQETLDFEVLTDLEESMRLKLKLDQLFEDLESFKARAPGLENINRMGMSSLERLNPRLSSVCLFEHIFAGNADHVCTADFSGQYCCWYKQPKHGKLQG